MDSTDVPSGRLTYVKLALSGIRDMMGPVGAPAIPIVGLASASIFLIERVETLQANRKDLEDLAYDAGIVAYQYIRVFQENKEPQKEYTLYQCISNMKRTIQLITEFAEKQKQKQKQMERLNTTSTIRRAQDWISKIHHAEEDKNVIADLRNQFQRDANLILITAALVTLAPSMESSQPRITTGMPMTRPGRKPGDLVPYFHWIKTVMIEKWSAPALSGTNGVAVLDIACGKGGDLDRWKAAGANIFVGLDSSKKQIAEAVKWHPETVQDLHRTFRAEFSVVDCFDAPLSEVQFPFDVKHFDIVSIQVSMHIVWKTEKRVKQTLKNVGKSLRKGGLFVGTMFDDEQSHAMIRKLPNAGRERSFGNTAYKVTFPKQDARDFGQRYVFSLFGTAENRQRYAVPWKIFVKMAGWYGLRLQEVKNFKRIFEEEHISPAYRKLLHEMNIVDKNNNLYMDMDQWEAANFYIAFTFVKDD